MSVRRVVVVVMALVLSALGGTSATATTSPRTLLWSDEFNGPLLAHPSSQWELMTGGAWGDHELESYTARAANVRLSGTGKLQIVARHESYTGADGIHRNYTSARLMGRHAFRYGYLVANMRIPKGQGLWPAFWTLGADIRTGVHWPYTGEIDVMESINQMSFVAGTLHGPDTRDHRAYGLSHAIRPPAGWTAGWHQYGIYWTATAITWYFDGHAIGTIHKSDLDPAYTWEFSKPHVPLLNLAVGGSWPGAPDASTPFPSMMSVSSVRLFNHP